MLLLGDKNRNSIRGRIQEMMHIPATTPAPPASGRLVQLDVGIICMVMIANLQYGWTLFGNPIDEKYHWGRPAIQVAFTIFVLTETWLVPVEGWLVDTFGPKIVVLIGGVLVGLPGAIKSAPDTPPGPFFPRATAGAAARARPRPPLRPSPPL